MSSASLSFPPPPAPVRRPGLARCSPERYAEHVASGTWFQRWCRERHISERDLATILDVAASVARRKLTGESPVNLVDIKRFPARHRNDLVLAYVAWCASLDLSVSHG